MKYKLTDETTEWCGHILHRIECVEDFANAKKGEKGGWIESENNLSQIGNCWVYDNAVVFENARVYDDAIVYGNAMVFENAKVYDSVSIYGNAMVYGNVMVYGDAVIFGNTLVYGNAWVFDNAMVYGDAMIYGNAVVRDNAKVYSNTTICGDARVESSCDYIVFKNNWSSGRYFTWTKSNDKWKVGCFYGTGAELIEKAYKDSENSGNHYKAYVKSVEKLKSMEE